MSEASGVIIKKSLQEKLELGRHLSDEWPTGGDADTGSTGAQEQRWHFFGNIIEIVPLMWGALCTGRFLFFLT